MLYLLLIIPVNGPVHEIAFKGDHAKEACLEEQEKLDKVRMESKAQSGFAPFETACIWADARVPRNQ